jgi:plasmid stabilization system protein ParE
MIVVRIRPRARRDLDETRAWYESQSIGLGERFGGDIDVVIRGLAESPLIYQKVYKNIRRAMTRHFPYSVYFVVEGERVSVMRVLHQSRNPDEWQR